MNDTDLIDSLQRLLTTKVACVRTCRSGTKIEAADGDFVSALEVREYFGAGSLRVAIERAVASEFAGEYTPLTPHPLPSMTMIPDIHIDFAAGHAWQLDPADVIEYGPAYFDEYRRRARGPMAMAINAHRLALASRYCRSLTDVGIGCGQFLDVWRAAGGVGHGHDVAAGARRWLEARGLWREAGDLARGVDGVTLWDVLEHLADPSLLLRSLSVGQYLLLTVPVIEDLERLRAWRHYKPREHLHYWTHRGLIDYFRRAGLDLVETDDVETRLGRADIRSYVFRRATSAER